MPTPSNRPQITGTNEGFLESVFGSAWDKALVALFLGDPGDPRQAEWGAYPASQLPGFGEQSDYNTYFCPSLTRGVRRQISEFESFHVLVLDDYGTKIVPGTPEKLLGFDPSYLLESSPGNYQAGWVLEPVTDLAWLRGFLQKLRDTLGCGDNLTDPMCWRRLPIGVNGKAAYRDQNGLPWDVKMVAKGLTPIDMKHLAQNLVEEAGTITPSNVIHLNTTTRKPDQAEVDQDAVYQVLVLLGLVLDRALRPTTMGWGLDVECPWAGEHTDRTLSGAVYVPVVRRFQCHHGHCQDRTMADVLARIGEMLDEASGGLDSVAAHEFEVISPGKNTAARVVTPGAVNLWDQKTPPKWSGGILPGVLEDTLDEVSRRNGLDPGALGGVMMTAGSGAADKRAMFHPYGDWDVRPILWTMLIGETGIRKTAILQHPLARLRKLNAERMRQHGHMMAQWRLRPPGQKQLPAPSAAVLLAEDTTVEKLQEWMAGNPRGLLYLRDELAGLFDFGRYSSGPGAAERAFFLQAYDGGPYTVGRMSRTTSIDNTALALLGGIQPQRLSDFKNLAEDGLLSRIGCIMVPAHPRGEDRAGKLSDLSAVDTTIDRMLRTSAFDTYEADPAGRDLIRTTEKLGEVLQQTPGIGLGYRGFLRKLHGTHARTALVLHLMDGGQDQIIPEDTIMRAARYTVFLLDHAAVFYAGLPGSADATAQAIGSYLLRHKTERVTAGLLRRDIAACKSLRSLKEIQDAVFLLVIGGWLTPETQWPSNSAWRVRPGLGDQFAERYAIEAARVEDVKRSMNHLGRYR